MNKSIYLVSTLITVASFLGCTKTETVVEASPIGEEFELSFDQYVLNHYFVDTSYIAQYEPYYQNSIPIVNPASQIIEAEVWGQRQGSAIDPDDRFGVAWISLPSRPSEGYDSSYRTSPEIVGSVEFGRFYRLDPLSYHLEGDGLLGVLSINLFPLPDIKFAIAYRRADGSQYGDFLRNGFIDSTTTPMVLKMIKPTNLFSNGPRYPTAWRMLLKNIYYLHLGPAHVSRYAFELGIFRAAEAGDDESAIQGQPLLRVVGLDRFDADGVPTVDGDGLFDFRLGLTIDQDAGEIIFPSLRPLDNGIREYFMLRGLPPPDSLYIFSDLYDTTWTVAQQSPRNRYFIRGRAIFD